MLYLELRSLAFLSPFFSDGSFFAVNSGCWHTTEGVQDHVNYILSRAQQSWEKPLGSLLHWVIVATSFLCACGPKRHWSSKSGGCVICSQVLPVAEASQ